jgi:hypothetical protein
VPLWNGGRIPFEDKRNLGSWIIERLPTLRILAFTWGGTVVCMWLPIMFFVCVCWFGLQLVLQLLFYFGVALAILAVSVIVL